MRTKRSPAFANGQHNQTHTQRLITHPLRLGVLACGNHHHLLLLLPIKGEEQEEEKLLLDSPICGFDSSLSSSSNKLLFS
jgi:hypothetical protein